MNTSFRAIVLLVSLGPLGPIGSSALFANDIELAILLQ